MCIRAIFKAILPFYADQIINNIGNPKQSMRSMPKKRNGWMRWKRRVIKKCVLT